MVFRMALKEGWRQRSPNGDSQMHRANAETQSVWLRTEGVPKTGSKDTLLGVSEKK